MFLAYVYSVLIIIFLIFLRYSFWRKIFCRHLPGKAPNFFNVLGDIPEFWQSKDLHQGVMELFRERVQMFKKEQFFYVWILYEPFILFIKADAIKQLLLDVKMNDRSWVYDRLHPIIGTGLVTSTGAKWKSQRKLLMPCFHPNILRSFLTTFNAGAQKLVTTLREETKKDFTLIANPIKLSMLNIICETIFGTKINTLDNEFSEYFHAVNRMEDIFMTCLFSPWLWLPIIFWNSRIGKEYKHHINVMKQLTSKIIREKRDRYLEGETDTQEGRHKSMMDLLMQKHIETQELSEEDIREQVDTFTIAGYETTATSAVWALYLIGLYPDVQAKLHEEIDEIFEKDVERHVTERDLQDLEYLDCVLKESNRLYPPIPIFLRQAHKDTNICGNIIPRGTGCAIFPYFLHRDEDVFPDPEAFKPERFLPENRANLPMCAYAPFSAGQRSCIGYKFAEMNIRVLVSSILRNFTIESLDEREKIKPVLKASLQPSIPIRIRIRSRSIKKVS